MARNPNSIPRRGGPGSSKALEINVRAGATLDYSSINFDECAVSAEGDDLLLTLGDGRSLLYRGLAKAARDDGPVDIRLPGDEVLPASAAIPRLLGEAPAAPAAETIPAAPPAPEAPQAAPVAAARETASVTVAPAPATVAVTPPPVAVASDDDIAIASDDEDDDNADDDDDQLDVGDWFSVEAESLLGPPDTPIPLRFKPVATGPGQRLSVVIFGVPDDSRLSAGSEMGGGAWRLRGEDIAGLTLTAAPGDSGEHELTVLATLVDERGGTESASSSIALRIDPAAPPPVAAAAAEPAEAPPDLESPPEPSAAAPAVSVAAPSAGSRPVRVSVQSAPAAEVPADPAPAAAVPAEPVAAAAAPAPASEAQIRLQGGDGDDIVRVAFDVAGWLAQLDLPAPLAFGISGLPQGGRLTSGIEAGRGIWGVVDTEIEDLQVEVPRGTEQFRLMVTATPADFDQDDTSMRYATASVQFDLNSGAVRVAPVSATPGAVGRAPQAADKPQAAAAEPAPARPAAAPATGTVVGTVAPQGQNGRRRPPPQATVAVRPQPAAASAETTVARPARPPRAAPAVNVQAQTSAAAPPPRANVSAQVSPAAAGGAPTVSVQRPAEARPVAVAAPPPQAPQPAAVASAPPAPSVPPPQAASPQVAPAAPAEPPAPAAPARPEPQIKQIDLSNAPDGEAAFDRDDVIEMTDADNLLYVTGQDGCVAVLHGNWRLLIENVQDADVGHRVNIYENQGARVATNAAVKVQVVGE